MGLIPVPDGQLASVVTSLEMRARPPLRPVPPSPFRLLHWEAPANARYRALFRRVGTPWLWYSRLVMEDDRLAAILSDPQVEVYALTDRAGIELGMLELDFRTAGECLIAYFALVPELTGKGHGRWMMAQALAWAWRPGVARVHVNTCTLDHPAALPFYQRSGFCAYRRTVETFADPRLAGVLPADAAPYSPCLGGSAASGSN